jgi:hypothetical protein
MARRRKRRWAAAFNDGGVAPVVTDECGEVLQLEGDKGVRRGRLIEENRGSGKRSQTNAGRRRGSGEITCGPASSDRRRWIGGGGCRVSSCGRGSGEKMGEKEGVQWWRWPF